MKNAQPQEASSARLSRPFSRLMAQALTSRTKKYGNLVMCYVYDELIATPTAIDNIDRLDEVFNCVKRAGMKCKSSVE